MRQAEILSLVVFSFLLMEGCKKKVTQKSNKKDIVISTAKTNANHVLKNRLGSNQNIVPVFKNSPSKPLNIPLKVLYPIPTPTKDRKLSSSERKKAYENFNKRRSEPIKGPVKIKITKLKHPITDLKGKLTPMTVMAIKILQGTTVDGFFDLKRVNEIAAVLQAIFNSCSGLSFVVKPSKVLDDSIILMLNKKTISRLKHLGKADKLKVERIIKGPTGITWLDKLNKKYSVNYLTLMQKLGIAGVNFKYPMDIVVVSQIYAKNNKKNNISSAGEKIGAMPDLSPGQYSNRMISFRRNNKLHLIFMWGWEDCPSGCNYRKFAYFTYDPELKIVINENSRAEKYNSINLPLWNIPYLNYVPAYKNFARLKNSINDKRWWISVNAIIAISQLFDSKNYVDRIRNTQDKNLFFKMSAKAKSQKKLLINLLIPKLSDKDSLIKNRALETLKKISGKNFGSSTSDIAKWKKWIKTI